MCFLFDRGILKANAKAAFKSNYWRCVVVALIIALIVGGGATTGKNRVQHSVNNNEQISQYDTNGNGKVENEEFAAMLSDLSDRYGARAVAGVVLALVGVVSTFAAVGGVISALVINPLSLGCDYFFLKNSEEPADIGEIGRGFSPEWWNNVVVMFLRGLFLVLWGILFVIPGLVKMYSYRLVPYIQAEDPSLHGTEAITLSRSMMRGHKWEAFVFDLSFIGWYILDAFTAGIAGVFWVHPYKAAADAELYRAIRDEYNTV